jgi:hypothetical protein
VIFAREELREGTDSSADRFITAMYQELKGTK